MNIRIIDPATGKEFTQSIAEPKPDFYEFAGQFEFSDEQLRARIDRMDISADAKAMLYSFTKATITVGKTIIKIGRKIIDILFTVLRSFPHLTFGVIFGYIVGALIATLPFIGAWLASIVTPLAILFGIVLAFPQELQAGELGARISAIVDKFAPLRA